MSWPCIGDLRLRSLGSKGSMGMTHPIWTPLTCPFQICMGLMGMKRDRQKWGLLLMLRLPVLLKISQMFHYLMAMIVDIRNYDLLTIFLDRSELVYVVF